MRKGYIQVYTGNGKGKTTACLGLVLRACGAGLRVYLGQFIKAQQTSEIKSLKKRFPEVKVEQYGPECFIIGSPCIKDRKIALAGFAKLKSAVMSGKYDLVIADEINPAVAIRLLPLKNVVRLIKAKPEHVELVLTGRSAHRDIIRLAHLVTEMKDIKHYFDSGVKSRKGIEE